MQGWMAQLSNGEIYYEAPPKPNDYSSWQKLLRHLKSSNIGITRLSVVRGSVEIFAMPPKMCNGYFQAYEEHLAFFRKKIKLQMQGVGSRVDYQVYITWITFDGLQVRGDIRPLDSCKVHTTSQ